MEAAASLAVRMPAHADELAVLLNARAPENGHVSDALAQMSVTHEGAWELYRARLTTPGDPGRHWAVMVSWRADEKRVAPILDAALDDPDAEIAMAAVRALTSWALPMTPARHERLDFLATALSDRLDTSVKITLGAKKGRVSIEFASVDDLNRIMGVIAPGSSN